tara:strand:- start:335 stop:1819 length:1485 start_codon:yes stop_codon:yes gene_type:complete
MSTIVLRSVKGSPLTNTEVDTNFSNLNTDKIESVASADGSIVVTKVGTAVDLAVSLASPASVLVEQVRNTTGATLTKGTAVYISGATGQLPTVSKALATGDATSAQTLGLITSDLANNSNGYVTIIGLIANINTNSYTDGQQLYLSPTTAGELTATKPYAPQHLVYVAVVAHAHITQGKLLVKVQNGYEMDELHNVSAQSPTSGQTLIYNASTSLWEKANLTAGAGISVANGAGSISLALAANYGDTQNPYASKTANYFLAASDGTAGVPTFRAVVAADIPTLNQNTTGSSGSCTGNAATATTATNLADGEANQIHYQTGAGASAFAVAPVTTDTFLKWDGAAFAWAAAGLTITDDTTTNATYYPTLATAVSGTLSSVNASSTKLSFNPSTGALTATSVSGSSDESLKENWRELPVDFIELLANAKHGIYDRIDTGATEAGLSAQSMQQILKEVVIEYGDEKLLSIMYGNAALLACVKLSQRVLELEKQLKERA